MRVPTGFGVVGGACLLASLAANATEPAFVGDSSDGPLPVMQESLDGEWVGLGADGATMLVATFSRGSRDVPLTISRSSAGETVVLRQRGVLAGVEGGRVAVTSIDRTIRVQARLFRYPASGSGEGALKFQDVDGQSRQVRLFFFHRSPRSWLDGIADLDAYGRTPTAAAGDSVKTSASPR